MESTQNPVHFVLIPFLAPGHLIPMVDLGRLLSEKGMHVTVVTTPSNASRFKETVDRCKQSNLSLMFHTIQLPPSMGLVEGSDNMESITTSEDCMNLFLGAGSLEKPLMEYLREEMKKSSRICVVSDFINTWTWRLTDELKIPRFVFYSVSCFTLSCHELLRVCYNREECGFMDVDYPKNKVFVVPEIPHRIEVTQEQAPGFVYFTEEHKDMLKVSDSKSDGFIVNTVVEMESTYVDIYQNIMGKKTWAVGPVSLCNKDVTDMTNRGSAPSMISTRILTFLDSMGPKSVIYLSLGSLARTTSAQAAEIGLGLEECIHPFIWVVRSSKMDEVELWLKETKFEERNKAKGLVIKGWVPQVMILSHPSVGGFITHCGWNSAMEGITYGLPMITWPCFSDQFLNEKFIVDVIRTGVMVGVKDPVWWWEDVVAVKREMVSKAVKDVMGCGEESMLRKMRAYKLGEMVRKAMDTGGSSLKNLEGLIKEALRLAEKT